MPADGSGEIDRMEFTRLLLRLNIKQSEEALSALWSNIDEDGSGAVSHEEFCVWWDRWKETLASPLCNVRGSGLVRTVTWHTV